MTGGGTAGPVRRRAEPVRRRAMGERARLTVLYAALLTLAGTVLIGAVYLVVRHGLDQQISHSVTVNSTGSGGFRPGSPVHAEPGSPRTCRTARSSRSLPNLSARPRTPHSAASSPSPC
ncbi:hypothetical protein NKH77_25195 [Streptomyces sp. M19]